MQSHHPCATWPPSHAFLRSSMAAASIWRHPLRSAADRRTLATLRLVWLHQQQVLSEERTQMHMHTRVHLRFHGSQARALVALKLARGGFHSRMHASTCV
jgi:hypothetical protein